MCTFLPDFVTDDRYGVKLEVKSHLIEQDAMPRIDGTPTRDMLLVFGSLIGIFGSLLSSGDCMHLACR